MTRRALVALAGAAGVAFGAARLFVPSGVPLETADPPGASAALEAPVPVAGEAALGGDASRDESPAGSLAPAEPPASAEAPEWDGEGDPPRAFVRARIEALVASHLPDRHLTAGQLESAVDAALVMHEANRELGRIQTDAGAERRREAALERARRAADEWRALLAIEPIPLPPLR